jgi:elongation factor Ts
MQITASMVKELRERTGAGMMECKKALTGTGGDMEAAIELMRKSGKAKADKRAGRVAAEGAIVIADRGTEATILEINCETDFVAKDGQFRAFAANLAELVLDQAPADVEALKALPMPDAGDLSVEQARLELVSKIGENIQLRRFQRVRAAGDRLGRYLHGQRIGVLVDMKGGDERLAKDIAMHIAASRPVCVTEHNVPQAMLDKEREIFSAQAQDSGKPPHIIDKMVQGRLKKYLSEITLLGQPFVKDPDKTVGQMLGDAGAEVLSFIRFEVGEGVEKKAENFAEQVMAQVKGA